MLGLTHFPCINSFNYCTFQMNKLLNIQMSTTTFLNYKAKVVPHRGENPVNTIKMTRNRT